MKKFLTKKAVPVAIATSIGALFALSLHVELGEILVGACDLMVGLVIYNVVSDIVDKFCDTRKLVNAHLFVYDGATLAGAYMAARFVHTDTIMGFVWLGAAAILFAFAVFYFNQVYKQGLKKEADWDEWARRKAMPKLLKLVAKKDEEGIVDVLGWVLRYNCRLEDYRKGSDPDRPFDADRRNWRELMKSDVATDKQTAGIVKTKLVELAQKLVATGYNGEDVAMFDAEQEGDTDTTSKKEGN